MTAEELARRFDIPDALRCKGAPGGLTRLAISTPEAGAELYLQGAHLASWTPRGERPVLFLSPKSAFVPGKAIRGGVPIIFPWFGAREGGKPGPAHGFARTMEWTMESANLRDGGKMEITLSLVASAATRELVPTEFRLRYRVTVGAELEMELETQNDSKELFVYEAALHTYLAVGDVRGAFVSGLEGTTYIDKTDGFQRKTQPNEVIRISKETDQVHVGSKTTCTVTDPVWNRRIIVEKTGSNSTVIWNPWIEKTKTLSDMPADGWKNMLCVETANAADDAVRLASGASHKLTAAIRLEAS